MRSVVVVASCSLCVAVFFVGGCFELERSTGTGEGKIRFVVRDSAGAPVAGATVFADGAERFAKSDENGNVSVEGLVAGDYVLRVGKDDDNDGVVDRAAVVTATLAVVPFDKGPFISAQEQLTKNQQLHPGTGTA